MASNSIEDPSYRQQLEGGNDQIQYPPAALQTSQPPEEEKRKKKRETDKKHYQKKKQKIVDSEVQEKTLREEVSRLKARNEFYEKDMKKLISDQANEFKEIVKNLKSTAGSQNDVNCKNWELLKQLQPQILGGSISATTNELAYPQVELTVTAMKSNRSFITESFKACQSLPEEWARLETAPCGQLIRAFYGLKHHYTASTMHHADEIARLTQEKEIEKEKFELELEKLKEELASYKNIWGDIGPLE